MNEFFNSWAVQNTVTLVVVAGLSLLLWRLSRREYWRSAAQEVCRHKGALLCLVILALYAFVALLDSVGWRKPLLKDGVPMKNAAGQLLLDNGESVLDKALAPLARQREKTYSAPLASHQFTSVTQKGENGRLERVYPSLNYPQRHLLGTDIIGADVLVQCLKSVRVGLIVGLLTTLLVVPLALFLGMGAGYWGGIFDDAVQYVCTVLNSIPTILLIAALMVVCGRGLPQLCIAMGIASWTGMCRLVRGEAMRLREAEFVQAAQAMGVSSPNILLRHIMPNVMHLVLINVVLKFSGLVLTEATLTYLGLGVDANTMSWGTMINDARTELTRDPVIWWKISGAFVFMLGLVLPANIFGDAVRDALDPRLKIDK